MFKKLFFYFIICMLAGSIFCCSTSKKVPGAEEKAFQEIDGFLQSLIDTAGIPGIAIAITSGQDMVYSKGFGVTDMQTKEKLEPRHIFHVASISKTFTATAVVQLFEKGKLDINKPLLTYLPYFSMKDERFRNITIRQMLNHTSGMPDVDDYEWEKAISDEGAAERYTRSLKDSLLISNPGTEFHYSNIAFDIMADLIAKVSGMSFEKYVKENILIPLEMYGSSFYAPEIKKSLRTSPHTGIPPTVSPVYPYNRMHAPSSTLNTNVLDMSHWAIANLNSGKYKEKQILSPEMFAMMMNPTFETNPKNKISIGLSWFMYSYNGSTIYEHGGSDLGYKSLLTLIPIKKIGIIILCNYENIRMYDTRNKIRDILMKTDNTLASGAP